MPRRLALAALLALSLLSLLGLGACGSESPTGSGSGPLVVATTTQLADFTRIVGGEDVEVYALLRPNVDAHDFDPSPADLDALARADVIIENGLGLEEWLDDAVRASGTKAERVDTSVGAFLLEGHSHDHDHEGETEEEHAAHAEDEDGGEGADAHAHDHSHDEGINPHLWFDPRNAEVMVRNIATGLSAAVPGAAEDFATRAAAYQEELQELDTWITAQIDTLSNRALVTDHAAFDYYFDRYAMHVVGTIIPSFDTAAEVSPAALNTLAEAIRTEGVKAIFTEQSLSPKAAETLAKKTGAKVVSGDDGLYGDSLGPAGSSGDTYLKMMRHNTTSIVTNLS